MERCGMTLDQLITQCASEGYLLVTRTSDQAVMRKPRHVNHAVHAVLSILTLGFWLWIWLIVAVSAKDKTIILRPVI